MAKSEQDRCGVEGCRRRWVFRSREPGRAVVVGVLPGSPVYMPEEVGSRQVEDRSAPSGMRVEVEQGPDRSWPAPRVESSAEGVSLFCGPHFTVLGMVGAVGAADARWWIEAGDG